MSANKPRLGLRRKKLLTGAAVATLAAFSAGAALAQEATEVEEIVITGSRLSTGTALEAAQPVQVVSSEVIAAQGTVAIADLLDTLPALLSSTSSA